MQASLNTWLGVEGWDDPRDRATVRWAFALAAVALALRLGFWAYTGRVWEDALITVQHSENCAQGLGLTHHPSEPHVHGFTSPLSVLVPLAGDLVHVGFGIVFIRMVSALCGPLTVLCVASIALDPRVRLSTPAAVLAMGYVAIEHHQIFFGMSGMETQMAVLVLLASMYYLIADKPIHLGVALGLCMLARPDFGFWAVIVGVYLLCAQPRNLPRVVGAAFAIYGPWLAFTTLYYGSPIPNTLIAKSLGYPQWWRQPGLTWGDWKRTFVDNLVYDVFAQLGPTHLNHALRRGTWFWDKRVISDAMIVFALAGAAAALLKKEWRLAVVGGFLLVYGVYYAVFVPNLFPWYFAPVTASTILLSAYGLDRLASRVNSTGIRAAALSVLAIAYLATLAAVLPTTFRVEKQIQDVVENGVRKQIGLYLAGVMKPDETLGLEPLGYVGYYARRTTYDYPGMGSRIVTNYLRAHPDRRSMNGVFGALLPDYVLLRPYECDAIRKAPDGGWLDRDYRLDREFAVPASEPAWLQEDFAAHFLLFKKIAKREGAAP